MRNFGCKLFPALWTLTADVKRLSIHIQNQFLTAHNFSTNRFLWNSMIKKGRVGMSTEEVRLSCKRIFDFGWCVVEIIIEIHFGMCSVWLKVFFWRSVVSSFVVQCPVECTMHNFHCIPFKNSLSVNLFILRVYWLDSSILFRLTQIHWAAIFVFVVLHCQPLNKEMNLNLTHSIF